MSLLQDGQFSFATVPRSLRVVPTVLLMLALGISANMVAQRRLLTGASNSSSRYRLQIRKDQANRLEFRVGFASSPRCSAEPPRCDSRDN